MRIGVVAPARSIDILVENRVKALIALTFPEVDIVFHPQCFMVEGHFAGSDAVRAAAFLEFANDAGIDAIWFARGGYGSNRILETILPQLNAAAKRKTYLGYSDMGFMLGALYARRIGRPAHGPMPSEVGRRNDAAHCVSRALAWLVNGDRKSLEPTIDSPEGIRRPHAAFNLAILTSLIGSKYLPDLTDHVLMIEEVSEPLYRVDRMLFTMAHATQLKGIAGIRLGQVNDVIDNDVTFNETPEQMIVRWCAEMGVPYLGRAQIGHYADNCVVPFGVA
jgi:muramoyltetrapeptide carboxypeptidase